jgi:AcrR family transcriptional regulator
LDNPAMTNVVEKRPARARQYHKGNVAEDLKLAASHILETERVEDLSVRRLAREVGVTPANFYNHFASLNDLLLEIGAEAFLERAGRLDHIRRTSKTRAEAIKRATTSYLDLAISRHQIFRIMFGLIPDSQKNQRFREASDVSMGKLVELVYGEKLHDPSDLEATRLRCTVAYGLLALGYGLARIVVDGSVPFSAERQTEMRRFVESVIDSLISGEAAELAAR